MSGGRAALPEDEWARRRQIVDDVRVSTALEGGRASDRTHELQEQWVLGEITFAELSAGVRAAHPSTADGPESD